MSSVLGATDLIMEADDLLQIYSQAFILDRYFQSRLFNLDFRIEVLSHHPN
jgi:hypothetical protein